MKICKYYTIYFSIFCIFLLILINIAFAENVEFNVKTLDLTSQDTLTKLKNLKVYTVKVSDDPIYKEDTNFQSYSFEDVLTLISKSSFSKNIRSKTIEDKTLRFTARDGYKINADLNSLPLKRGYLAFRELKAPEGLNFREINEGREKLNPSPFILIWEGQYNQKEGLPLPLALVKIEIGTKKEIYGDAYPLKSNIKGFELFNTHCSSCHSINKAGGVIGPELNVPKNITEYLDEKNIIGIIKNPSNYRYGSRMPAFEKVLSKDQIRQIVGYIRAMKKEKICNNKKKC